MQTPSSQSFTWKGQSYEIRVTKDAGRTTVAAFRDGKPALPFTCSVDWETAARFQATIGTDPVWDPSEGLVDFIRQAIKEHYR